MVVDTPGLVCGHRMVTPVVVTISCGHTVGSGDGEGDGATEEVGVTESVGVGSEDTESDDVSIDVVGSMNVSESESVVSKGVAIKTIHANKCNVNTVSGHLLQTLAMSFLTRADKKGTVYNQLCIIWV